MGKPRLFCLSENASHVICTVQHLFEEDRVQVLSARRNLFDKVYFDLLVALNYSGLCDNVGSLPSMSPDATSAPFVRKPGKLPLSLAVRRLLFHYIYHYVAF